MFFASDGLCHFEFKPALLLGIHYKIYSRGDADQEEPSQELRWTTKAKLAVLLPADHQHAEIAPSDPEVQLAEEVSAQARTLQERCPGACARATRQKGAQSDRRLSRYQLDGVKLACAS